MTTAEFGRVPLVPVDILARHKVAEASDDRFRSAARLRQALLREKYGWPVGRFPADGAVQRELGSYLAEDHNGVNFVTPDIARLAAIEVAYREFGALVEVDRLNRNMISSAPACFNFIGPLKLSPRLATSVMRKLCPIVHKVTDILFEHSPGRRGDSFIDRSASLTADRSAFDALCKITTKYGNQGFIAIECKYTESFCEKPAELRPRYSELSTASELFVDPDHPALRTAPLQQLWRQHLLSFAMVANGLYSSGTFLVLYPALNRSAQEAIALYRTHLRPDATIAFDAISYETMVNAIRRSGAKDIAELLHERYCDFSAVDALI